jgi:SulP family sulfate permease
MATLLHRTLIPLHPIRRTRRCPALIAPPRLPRLGRPTSKDVVSGFVTGLFSIPEGMAYASIGGFNPVLGLYSGMAPTLVTIATIGVCALARLVPRLKAMATLISLAVVTVAVSLLGVDVEKVADIATIPNALPVPAAPNLEAVPHLITGAIAVALVALAQAAGIGAAVPNPDGSKTDVSRDFLAQGLANLAGGVTQALPTGGSLSRTGVATSARARTRWSNVFAGLWLALIVVLVGKQAELIPMPVIGGVMVIGIELITGRRKDIVLVMHTAPLSAVAMIVTFLATTALPLQQAIFLGAGLSLVLFCVQVQRQARLVELVRRPDGRWQTAEPPPDIPSNTVTVLGYVGAGIFAELERIDERWPSTEHTRDAVVVLEVRTIPDVPSATLVEAFGRWSDRLAGHGSRLILAGVDPPLVDTLNRSGLTVRIGEQNIVLATGVVLEALESAYAEGLDWLAGRGAAGEG